MPEAKAIQVSFLICHYASRVAEKITNCSYLLFLSVGSVLRVFVFVAFRLLSASTPMHHSVQVEKKWHGSHRGSMSRSIKRRAQLTEVEMWHFMSSSGHQNINTSNVMKLHSQSVPSIISDLTKLNFRCITTFFYKQYHRDSQKATDPYCQPPN